MSTDQPARRITLMEKPAKNGPGKKARAAAAAAKLAAEVKPTAPPAHARRRHWGVLISFLIFVVVPVMVSSLYLWGRAVDRYGSTVGFTVQREEMPSAVDILGGLGNLSSISSSDSDILFEFIQSQDLVAQVDAEIDLRAIYGADYEADPIFSLKPDASLEELVAHWNRVLQVSYAPGTGLIEVRALANDAEIARQIAQTVFDKSSAMINALSDIAREDATRYARADLDDAVAQLKTAREELTAFRARTQIIDPTADIQIQMGVLTTMQQRLGDELIALDILQESAPADDPRVTQTQRRITSIRERIREERDKFGAADQTRNNGNYALLVAEFERLTVDLEFAQEKYTGALVNFDTARAEAQRQSRYLAAYIRPTLAETPEYPNRLLLIGLVTLFSFIGWGIAALIYYALRDRR